MLNIRGVLEVDGFSDEVVGDPGAHLHAMSYIEALSAADNGYQTCMELLTNGTSCDDRVKFHLLAAIKEYVNERYADEAAEGRERMRQFLGRYIAVQSASKRYDSAVVRLAAAQIHVIVFEFDYVLHWNDYFDDIVASAYGGLKTVDHTLRVVDLTSLWLKGSAEIEERMPEEFREIQLAREFMQINDLARVVAFLCQVIVEYEPLEVVALKVVHDLLTWIDVRFFDELKIIGVVTARLHTVEAWEVAADCFVLMTQRLRTPARKQAMLETVFALMTERLKNVSPSVYNAKIGHLHDVLGVSLAASHDEAMKCWQYDLSAVFRDMVADLFDKVLSFLAQPDRETSMSVAGFTLRYVRLMERYSCVHRAHVAALYTICADKMKLALDPNDFPEDVVNGYREALGAVFKCLTRVDKDSAYEMILATQTALLADAEVAPDVNELELSLYLLQLFCEARNEVAPKQITIEVDALLSRLVAPLVTSKLWRHPHPAITIRFFKTLSVGAAVVATDPSALRQVFALFVSEDCVTHAHRAVRQSGARFLRDTLANLPARVALPDGRRLIAAVQTLVADGAALSDDARLDLHETLAFLVKLADLSPVERRQLHGEIMSDALTRLRANACQWKRAPAKHRDQLATGVCLAIDIVSRSTLAFDQHELELAGCADNYLAAFEAFNHLPTAILLRGDIRGSMRRLVKRLVSVLADQFLPCVSDVILTICKTSSMSCIGEDTDMLVHLIDTYTQRLVPTLRKQFSLISESIYLPTALALSKDHGMSDGPFKEEFERNYLSYMRAIVRNNLFDQLFREGQKAHIFAVIYTLSSGCYPSLLPHETFQTFAAYLQMDPSDMLVYLDMITEEVKALFQTDFQL